MLKQPQFREIAHLFGEFSTCVENNVCFEKLRHFRVCVLSHNLVSPFKVNQCYLLDAAEVNQHGTFVVGVKKTKNKKKNLHPVMRNLPMFLRRDVKADLNASLSVKEQRVLKFRMYLFTIVAL